MILPQTVAADIVEAIAAYADCDAMSDNAHSVTYDRLGQFVASLS